MKCEECQTFIEDYVDGGLDKIDQKAGPLVNAHIAGCGRCTAFREELIREQAIYARYERDVDVTPMLWTSIEDRIKHERAAQPTLQALQALQGAGLISRLREQMLGVFGAPRLSPALAFALVLIAITVTVIVMTRLNTGVREVANNNSNVAVPAAPGSDANHASTPSATGGGEIAKTPTPAPATPVKVSAPRKSPAATALTPAQLVREAEQKYLTAIAMLGRDVNRKRSQLDPIMLARFDSALSDIDRTIKDTRRVVRDNPEDPIALQYLLAAYSKKVDVLRGMSGATTD